MQLSNLPCNTRKIGFLIRAMSFLIASSGCLSTLAYAQSAGNLATTPLPSLTPGGSVNNAPPFQYSASADLSERYIDNAQGTPTSPIPDYDSRATLALSASEESSRTNASVSYSGSVDYFARESVRPVFLNNLSANGVLSVLPDHFLFSAQAFATPVYQSQLGNIAPLGEALAPGATSSLSNTYGFSLQPDLFFRLGDILRSDLIPGYSAVYFVEPAVTPSNITGTEHTQSLMERITSGSDFSRLQLGAIADYSQMDQSSGGLTQRSATGNLSYAITQGFALVANGGYQSVKASAVLIQPASGPVLMGGVNFDLARLKGEVLAGEQYRSFSMVGHLLYQISPRITLQAAANDTVTTPLASLLGENSLLQSAVTALASGQLQLPSSGVITSPQLYNIGLQNEIARIRTATATFNYTLDNFTAAVTGFGTQQSALTAVGKGQNQNLQSLGVTPSLTYQFGPDLSVTGDMYYINQRQVVGADTDMQYDMTANYSLNNNIQLYLQGSYLQRYSDAVLASYSLESGSASIASIRLGIRYQLSR